jgi:hypothetical protein
MIENMARRLPKSPDSIIVAVTAGIVIPALSGVLFYLAAALSMQNTPQIVVNNLIVAPLFGIASGVIFGAPLAVPILLLVRPRRIWRAVPLLSLVGALGARMQLELADRLRDTGLYPLLFFIWIVPALLGAVTLIVLKRREDAKDAVTPASMSGAQS